MLDCAATHYSCLCGIIDIVVVQNGVLILSNQTGNISKKFTENGEIRGLKLLIFIKVAYKRKVLNLQNLNYIYMYVHSYLYVWFDSNY